MPSDIRSFFGGGSASQPSQEKASAKKPAPAKRGRARKVLDDSDDEITTKSSPKKAAPKKREITPEGEATTASDYFGNNKAKKSEPVRASPTSKEPAKHSAPAAATSATPKKSGKQANGSARATPSGRSSGRKKASISYNEEELADAVMLDDDEPAEDVFKAEFESKGKGRGDDYEEGEGDASDEVAEPRRVSRATGRQPKINGDKDGDDFGPDEDVDMTATAPDEDFVVPDDDEVIVVDKPAAKPPASAGRKRKSTELEVDDDEDQTPKKAKPTKRSTPAKPRAKKGEKKEEEPESKTMQAIFDSIPLVAPPTPPGADSEAAKFKFGGAHANSGPPPAAGSKEIPVGEENCLAGLSFVFTGIQQSLGREEGQALVKRYGGKVTGGPSSKTSYVVLGSDAGPSKLKVIAQHGLKTISEDGLFELIRRLPANGGDSKAAAKNAEKKDAEFAKIKEMAAEVEKEERRTGGAGGAGLSKKSSSLAATNGDNASTVDTRLWTVRYAPTQMAQICGNKQPVEKLQKWLRMFPKNVKTGFKMAGADGSGVYRAVIISGPPGIGKTTAAHLVAKLEGYDIVESNASDTRSKKLVETGLRGVLNTTSLLGFFAGDGAKVDTGKKKLCLIMDEVDGMSAGDRGGVGALAALCKKSEIPMILICNERKLPKMKPFDYCTFNLPFRRPTTDQIRSRIMTIAFREKMKLPQNVVDALIEGTGADIRQVINMISTVKLDQKVSEQAVDFDQGKSMSKAWQKHVILRPWDILSKILGGGMFASSSKATLNDKSELYFNDHEFSYLMLQENYLGTKPMRASNYTGREGALKTLELVEQAANSISEGDLVDRLIHGPEQLWSLMPTHAIFSFVRPASFVAGTMAGNQTSFPSWLGKNSSQGKNTRAIKEIQGHMRLRSSADRHEIRQQYIPALWSQLIRRMQVDGKDCIEDVVNLMDSYFLTKEDWDAILELGVGEMDQEKVKIESQTKATFTRLYNAASHPMPFMKASNVVAPKRTAKVKPDLEEAIDESDDAEVVDDAPDEEDDLGGDVLKDKYVKAPKKKKAGKAGEAAGKAPAKGKKRSKAEAEDDEEEDDEEDVKPKKGKGKAPAKGRAKK